MEAREQLKKHLQDNIDFEYYNPILKPTLGNLYLTFRNEYLNDNELKRQGNSIPKVISEWLRGLPSCLDMPYYTYDIINLMKAIGYEVETMEDIDVDDLYWKELGEIINSEK